MTDDDKLFQDVQEARIRMDEARAEMVKDLSNEEKYQAFQASYRLFIDLSGRWLDEMGKRQAALDSCSSWLTK